LTRVLDALKRIGHPARPSGAEYIARCPAHDDRKPSLAVGEKSGKAVLFCHARCHNDDILKHLSLSFGDLFDQPLDRKSHGMVARTVKEYGYADLNGGLVGIETRQPAGRDGKRPVYPMTPNPDGSWSAKASEALKTTPFQLPLVVAAVDRGDPVWIAEGPSDATTLTQCCGVVATSNQGGAGKWTAAHSHWVKGADVIVCLDRDTAGDEHGRVVLATLVDVAHSVTVKQPPVPHKDVTELIEAGGTLDQLETVDIAKLLGQAPQPPTPEGTSPHDSGPNPDLPGGRRINLTQASSITMRRVRWLWADRIPLGELSLLGGREGIGKSIVCYQLIADITRGRLPGEHLSTGRPVIVAATEDSWDHTIVPRLTAAGADLDKVWRIDVTTADDIITGLVLPLDLAALKDTVDKLGAVMVLLDPLLSRLDDRLDTHKDADVRRALEPLARLAHDCGVAVLGLIHVNKSGSSDPLTSLMASRAFAAVVRSVLFCMIDPEDESGERRILGQPKNNLGRDDQPALVFTITTAVVGTDPEDGKPITCGRMVWQGEADKGLRELIAASQRSGKPRTLTDEAAEWLQSYLTEAGGRAPSIKIKEDAKNDEGISQATLTRARSKLPIVVETASTEEARLVASEGAKRVTFWCLHVPGKPHLPGMSDSRVDRVKSSQLLGDMKHDLTDPINSNGLTREVESDQSTHSVHVFGHVGAEPTYSPTGEQAPPHPSAS
jgi:hypothetical protein